MNDLKENNIQIDETYQDVINETETECSKYLTMAIESTIEEPIRSFSSSDNSNELFEIIKKFYERYNERSTIQCVDEDIKLLRNTLKDYKWFRLSNKYYFNYLLDSLKILSHKQCNDTNVNLLSMIIQLKDFNINIFQITFIILTITQKI